MSRPDHCRSNKIVLKLQTSNNLNKVYLWPHLFFFSPSFLRVCPSVCITQKSYIRSEPYFHTWWILVLAQCASNFMYIWVESPGWFLFFNTTYGRGLVVSVEPSYKF